MHLHILGIGGTFMVGLARLALELGHDVSGSDSGLYPPMSTQLERLGVPVFQDYSAAALSPAPDLVVIGNALSRGNPAVEHVLGNKLAYISGPEWLGRYVLRDYHVIAVAGTHGKTTVSSLVAWMLEHAGLSPGFLIGGVVENFGITARVPHGGVFVIEADEYDTAFFDKRSKFLHYHPDTLVINNLEYDHADIFPDLDAIKRQFHHLIRTLPREARIIRPSPDRDIDEVMERGCWSHVETLGSQPGCSWVIDELASDQDIHLKAPDGRSYRAATPLLGAHNARNVAAAAAAAAHAGVEPATALAALGTFENVKRRLELRAEVGAIRVYDDFAHHPTAIAATIAALRSSSRSGRILAVTEPRSNTMRLGVHKHELGMALAGAEWSAILALPDLDWDARAAVSQLATCNVFETTDALIADVIREACPGDAILIMSNGPFDNIHERIIKSLQECG